MAKQKSASNITDKLNTILSNAELIPDTYPLREKLSGVMHLTEDGNYTHFHIQDADMHLYNEVLRELYVYNKEVQKSYTVKTLENVIENALYEAKCRGKLITDKTIEDIIKKLLDVEKVKYEIVHTISGVIFIEKVEFDSFFFSNYEQIKNHTAEAYMNGNPSSLDSVTFAEMAKNNAFVCVKVEARENEKAKELAYEKMKKIEAVMRFFAAAYGEVYDIGIFDFRTYNVDSAYIFSKENIGESSHCNGRFCDIDGVEFYKEYKQYLDELFNLIFKPDLTEMEKRILLAVTFCSRATFDRENAVGFLEAMMAIEALLQANSEGIVTPSITYQITEYCAFLLNSKLEGRKRLDKIIRSMYTIRSKISHGKQDAIEKSDYEQLWYIATHLIVLFLSDEKLKNMRNFTELQDYIKELKYCTKTNYEMSIYF